MGRGGKRPGAGRKGVRLDNMSRLRIGSECERRWREEIAVALRRKRDALVGKSDYREQVANLRATVPIEDRVDWHGTYAAEDHADDIEVARKQMAGMAPDDLEEAPRIFRVEATRPYRMSAQICREVSDWASTRYGLPVSPRYVKSCWAYFRATELAIAADEDAGV